MNTGSILPGHAIMTMSNGRIATCECDPDNLRFDWNKREEHHARHVLSTVWNQGARGGKNPYED